MTRTRMRIGAAALLALTAALLSPVRGTQGAPTPTPSCAAGQLVPTLRSWTVNQGLGSYAKLTQGKETLVRLFITMPSCASSNDTIQLTGGSLAVTGGVGGDGVLTPAIGNTPPTLGLTVSNDSPSNPIFIVPGAAVTSSTGAAFTATFNATLKYKAKPASSSTFGSEQSIVLPGLTETPITKDVNAKSNALRVLLVPMGDGTRGYSTDFPASASRATQTALENMGRALPVPAGLSDLTETSKPAGIRYRILPSLLDLNALGVMSPVNGVNKFCGSGSTFNVIKNKLASYLQTWNASNPLAAADRVLGVVWQDVAIGTDAGTGCDEGLASLTGAEAWFRASTTYNGAVANMEVLHTFGGSVGGDADVDYHSKNVAADKTDPDRVYNGLTHRYLADDRSAMNLSGAGWTENTTVLEPTDWATAQCRLTPSLPVGSTCTGSTVGGPAAAGSSFVLSGTVRTHGPDAPVADIHSWFESNNVEQTIPADSSVYALVQRGPGGGELRRTLLPYSTHQTAHTDEDHSHIVDGDDTIDVAVSSHALATVFELERDGVVIYRRVKNTAPTLVTYPDPAVSNVRNWSQDSSRQDRAPELSPDGLYLTWSDGANIFVRDVAKSKAISLPLAGSQPTWYQSDTVRRLAFVRGSDLYVTDVTTGSGAPTFSDTTIVYLSAIQLFDDPAASQPTWEPNVAGRADRLVFRAGGNLWELDVDLIPGNEPVCQVNATLLDRCRGLVTSQDVDEQHPSASSRGVVYDAAGTLHIVNPTTRAITDTGVAGSDPVWAGDRIVYTAAGGLWAVPADAPGAVAPTKLTSDADADTAPTATANGASIGFVRSASGDDEVFLADLGNGSGATIIATDVDAESVLEADLYVVCGGQEIPVVVDIDPDSVEGNVATFHVSYDVAPACNGASLRVRVTDGWSTSTADISGPFGSDDAPIPSIAAPLSGEYTEWESIPIAGSAEDDSSTLTFTWSLTYPDGSTQTLGSGESLGDVSPPATGWPTGTYTVNLCVSDNVHPPTCTSVTITIVDDDDNDGMPNKDEPCLASSADKKPESNPKNAYDDTDGDGIVNVDDPRPCTSDSTMTVDFDPNTLQLTSSGSPITTYLRSTAVGMSAVDPSTVLITRIGNYPVRFPATAWSVSSNVGTAQFSRPDVISFMKSKGLVGFYVKVVVSVTTTTGTSAQGLDAKAPVTQPA